ncbi:MAG: metallopeptidase TldD-related protein [Terracidiphilus sp.]
MNPIRRMETIFLAARRPFGMKKPRRWMTGVLPAVCVAGFAAGLLGTVCRSASAQQTAYPTRTEAERDPVLKAMLAEMDRSKSQLQLKGFGKPYFLAYRMEDVDVFETKAAFGATLRSTHHHLRFARVTVRVGDYKTDSSGGGGSALGLAALDEDPIALRSALWAATDQAYKSALADYAQKQAELKEVQTPPQADDFSHEPPVIRLEEPLKLSVDEAAWTARVARDSGLCRTDATVKTSLRVLRYSMATFTAQTTTNWLVTSEGTIVRQSAAEFQENFAVGAQADDGMSLDRSYATTGSALEDLDSPAVFGRHAVELIASLTALRNAPLVEGEYHGPVLLSSDAATDTLAVLLPPGLLATRPKLGTEARTNGPFASSYRTRVLPDFLDVTDDPGLKSYNGKGLVGAYDVDDEGVPAQAVKLIVAGQLENYLIGRGPVRDFPHSNGHGRAGIAGAPEPAIGVLKITARTGWTDEELNHKLLALGSDEGLKEVYFVSTMGPGLTPRLLYRIRLNGPRAGRRELVRGAALDDLDLRTLRTGVVAAGKNLWVTNYFGDVPETVLAPALLLDNVTIHRANEKNDRLPYYPPPE